MNYIKHLNHIFVLMDQTPDFKPYHISLYLALFRKWNSEHFINPISISRDDMMKTAKIGSPKTYLKALKELQSRGFIRYDPSHDPNVGSLINLFTYEQATCSLLGSKMPPYINIKHTHYIEEDKNLNFNQKMDTMEKQKNTTQIQNEDSDFELQKSTFKNQQSRNQKQKSIPPPFQHIQIYFQEKGHPEDEAQRFFNYYEANGWLVGGKTPMKDWKAAARNWMLNITKFDQKAREIHKKQFREKHSTPKQAAPGSNANAPLRPISQPPSSNNYQEPL